MDTHLQWAQHFTVLAGRRPAPARTLAAVAAAPGSPLRLAG